MKPFYLKNFVNAWKEAFLFDEMHTGLTGNNPPKP